MNKERYLKSEVSGSNPGHYLPYLTDLTPSCKVRTINVTRLERSCDMSLVKAQFVPNMVERET